MASVGRRACLCRLAHPLPLGAGEYVRPAGFVSVGGEGVGVFSRFSYLSSRCRVISSSPSSSPLVSHVLRSRSLCLSCVCPRVLVLFLIVLRPAWRRAERGVSCLLGGVVAALIPSSRFTRLMPPCLIAMRWIALVILVSVPRRHRLAHVLLPYRSSFLPVLRQAWAGRVSARRCLLVSLFSPALPRRAVDVRCRLWRAFLLGVSVSAGCCVGFVSGVLYI